MVQEGIMEFVIRKKNIILAKRLSKETFWEAAARSVSNLSSLFFVYL